MVKNLVVIFLVRAAELGMVVAKNEDAEFHSLTASNSRAWNSVGKHLTCAHRAYRRSRSFSSRRRSVNRQSPRVWLCRRAGPSALARLKFVSSLRALDKYLQREIRSWPHTRLRGRRDRGREYISA